MAVQAIPPLLHRAKAPPPPPCRPQDVDTDAQRTVLPCTVVASSSADGTVRLWYERGGIASSGTVLLYLMNDLLCSWLTL